MILFDKEEYKFWAKKLKIGETPLQKYPADFVEIYVKHEETNGSGSVKDRAALAMVLSAMKDGSLKHGGTVVEATSGNTGISLAYIGGVMGFNTVLTMPETMSAERRKMLADYGARLVLTPGGAGMTGAVEEAQKIAKNTPGAVTLKQFQNAANAAAHSFFTAREILLQLQGKAPGVFVAGVGTGGTLTGVASTLKRAFPNIQIIAVEPSESAVLSGENAGSHSIQGIGAGFVPNLLDLSVITHIKKTSSSDACDTAKMLNKTCGFNVGISSGANIFACLQLAETTCKNMLIVTLFPDRSDRYPEF